MIRDAGDQAFCGSITAPGVYNMPHGMSRQPNHIDLIYEQEGLVSVRLDPVAHVNHVTDNAIVVDTRGLPLDKGQRLKVVARYLQRFPEITPHDLTPETRTTEEPSPFLKGLDEIENIAVRS